MFHESYVSMSPERFLGRYRRWLDELDLQQLKAENNVRQEAERAIERTKKANFFDRAVWHFSEKEIELRAKHQIESVRIAYDDMREDLHRLKNAASQDLTIYMRISLFDTLDGNRNSKVHIPLGAGF